MCCHFNVPRMDILSSYKGPRGALIVFEGADFSGKTTHSKRLTVELNARGYEVKWRSFPDRSSPIGRLLDDVLEGKLTVEPETAHMLFAANRFERRDSLLNDLHNGTTIILDRYSYSGVAYTLADPKGSKLDARWCKRIEACKLPAPDQVFYMRLPIEKFDKRVQMYDWEGAKGIPHSSYESIIRTFDRLSEEEGGWWRIEANDTFVNNHTQIVQKAEEAVVKCAVGCPFKKLWAGYEPQPGKLLVPESLKDDFQAVGKKSDGEKQ